MTTDYNRPETQKRGGGCWFIGLLSLLIAAGLIVAGLFLPPVNLAERLFEQEEYTLFDPQLASPGALLAVQQDGLTVLVDPAAPGEDFGVALASQPRENLINGVDDLSAAAAALPIYLNPHGDVYSIQTTGVVPDELILTVALPQETGSTDIIDLYGWNATAGEWYFIPAHPTQDATSFRADVTRIPNRLALFQAAPINPEGKPTILTTLGFDDNPTTAALEIVDIVAPTGRQPAYVAEGDGGRTLLVGSLAPGFDTNAGYRVMPTVRNYTDPRAVDSDSVVAIISDETLRAQHVQQLTEFAGSGGYDGIMIDYRQLPDDQRENFSTFIELLAANLRPFDLELSVVVPAAEGVIVAAGEDVPPGGNWRTGAYDWRFIGQHADYVKIRFGYNPLYFVPGDGQLVEEMLRWAVGEISRHKILGGLTALSIQERDGLFAPVSYNDALAPLGNVEVESSTSETGAIFPGAEMQFSLDGLEALPGIEDTIRTPYIIYTEADGVERFRMWLTTPEALQFRIERIMSFGVRGVAFDDLLTDDLPDAAVSILAAYEPDSGGDRLMLSWRIEGDNGRFAEFLTNINEDITVTLEAPEGDYAVNVDVVSGDTASRRSSMQVALARPTVTPTAPPTVTPTAFPSPTTTPAPIQPTVPVPTADPNAIVDDSPQAPAGPFVPGQITGPQVGALMDPGPGADGPFELGGHVTRASNPRAHNVMREAGMSWLKVQLRYGRGADPAGAKRSIDAAHAAGFRVVLGIVGNPGGLMLDTTGYIVDYADYVGQVARLGPDAIEIWNEANIAREWPEGLISGSNYTEMLRASYVEIKRNNPNVIVISAAPAPTGAELDFPGLVVNDDNWMRQMVAAGGMNYLDCVGLHYNEGTLPPTATSGDRRGDFHTRYLPSMLNTYWSITGGTKPICITELGYLSMQDYGGGLPLNFGWAYDTSVSEHAQWLGQAVSYSANSGRVRLLIVWNVDFENQGADPMGGYAIIRADGSCPACSSLANAPR